MGTDKKPTSPKRELVAKTILITDIVGSTSLTQDVGDVKIADVLIRHDRIVRDMVEEYGGQEFDRTDGFLLLFDRPLNAVRFALAFHQAMENLSEQEDVPLRFRAGIHFGEVVVIHTPPEYVKKGAKPLEVEGLAKSITARLADLASERQTLLTREAFNMARHGAKGTELEDKDVQWRDHGLYYLKGLGDEFTEVFEVGIEGFSPLSKPQDKVKAKAASSKDLQKWKRASRLVPAAAVLMVLALALVALSYKVREEAQATDKALHLFSDNLHLLTGLTFTDPDYAKTRLDELTKNIAEFKTRPLVYAQLQDTIGEAYQDLGLYEEATPLLEEALTLREGTLGSTASVVVASLSHLAAAYMAQGRFDEARDLLNRAEAATRTTDHPERSVILGNMGFLYLTEGEGEKAEELLREALKIEQALDPGSLEVRKLRVNLGINYLYQGRFAEAREIWLDQLDALESTFLLEQWLIAEVCNNIADVEIRLAHYDRAKVFIDRALCRRAEGHGFGRRSRGHLFDNPGTLSLKEKAYDKAKEDLELALEIYAKSAFADSPYYAQTMNQLALLRIAEGRYSEAEGTAREALEIFKERQSLKTGDAVQSLAILGEAERHLEKYKEAEEHLEEARRIGESVLGARHPDFGVHLVRLARLRRDMGKVDEARALYETALGVLEEGLHEENPEHPDILTTRQELSELWGA